MPNRIIKGIASLKDSPNKNIALQFLRLGLKDIKASKSLKKQKLNSLAIYHLQQAVEKTMKAMILLDFENATLTDVFGHMTGLVALENMVGVEVKFYREMLEQHKYDAKFQELGLFREVFSYTPIHTQLLHTLTRFKTEIDSDKTKRYEALRQIETTEYNKLVEKFRKSGNKRLTERENTYLTRIFKNSNSMFEAISDKSSIRERANFDAETVEILLKIIENAIVSGITDNAQIKDINIWVKCFLGIFILAFITDPHEDTTRYPNQDIFSLSPESYSTDKLGVVKEFDKLIQTVEDINKSISFILDTVSSSQEDYKNVTVPIVVTLLLLSIILFSALELSNLNITLLNIGLLVIVGIILIYFYLLKHDYYNLLPIMGLVVLASFLLLYNSGLSHGANTINQFVNIANSFSALNITLIEATGIIASLSPLIAIEIGKSEDTRRIAKIFFLTSIFSLISLLSTVLANLLLPSLKIYTGSLSLAGYISTLAVLSVALFLISILLIIYGVLGYAIAKKFVG